MLVLSFFLTYCKTLQKPILALLSLVLRPISGKKMLQSSQRLTATLFFTVFRIPFLHFPKFWCSSGVISTHQMLQARINTGFICLMISSSGDLPKKRLFYSLCAIQRPYGIPYFSDYYMLFLCDPIIITKVAHW